MGIAAWALVVSIAALAVSVGTLAWNEFARRRGGPWFVVEAFHTARLEDNRMVQVTALQVINMGPISARVSFLGFLAPDGGMFSFSSPSDKYGEFQAQPYGSPVRRTAVRKDVEVMAGNHSATQLDCTPVAMFGNKLVKGKWIDLTLPNVMRINNPDA